LSSTSSYSGKILVSFADPNPPIIASNLNLSYAMMVTGLGNLPTSVTFSSISSSGIQIAFSPSNLSLSSQGTLMAMLSVGHNVTAGTYNLETTAVGGGGVFNSSFSIQVVQYVVAIEPAFEPANLTVTQGSTVTWVRLNGLVGEHGDNGSQNIVFNNGMAQSPQLAQYASYNYMFAQTGNFPYHSTYRTSGGEITVVAG
jgi:plastocyanin